MRSRTQNNQVLIISPYSQKYNGIAIQNRALVHSLRKKFGSSFSLAVCNIESKDEAFNYAPEVKYHLDPLISESYLQLAEQINNDRKIKLVLLQHDFNLFKGQYGEEVLYLIYSLKKPVLVQFNTVLSKPENKRKLLIKSISEASSEVIVASNSAAHVLQYDYNISEEKINVIPNGSIFPQERDKNILKKQLMLKGEKVISTFGFIRPEKSIETVFEALPSIIERHPSLIFQIIGIPEKHEEGKHGYLRHLKNIVEEKGLQKHVRFIDHFASFEEAAEYLYVSDVFVCTSRDADQYSSCCMQLALSCGCPVLATSTPYSRELLANGAGMTVAMKDPDALGWGLLEIIENPSHASRLSKAALKEAFPGLWENVSIKFANLFHRFLPIHQVSYDYPEIIISFLRKNTNQPGIKDLYSGKKVQYSLQDNSDALMAACMHYDITRDASDFILIDHFLGFLESSQKRTGWFFQALDSKSEGIKSSEVAVEEKAFASAFRALSYLISNEFHMPESIVNRAAGCYERAFHHVGTLSDIHAIAIAIKGLHFYNLYKNDWEIVDLIDELAGKVEKIYSGPGQRNEYGSSGYVNSDCMLPESLLYAYLNTKKDSFRETAVSWFSEICSGHFTRSMFCSGTQKNDALHSVEVASFLQTMNLFYDVLNDYKFREKMDLLLSWFYGNNEASTIIYNSDSAACYEGIVDGSVIQRESSRSTIAYILARLTMEKLLINEKLMDAEVLGSNKKKSDIRMHVPGEAHLIIVN